MIQRDRQENRNPGQKMERGTGQALQRSRIQEPQVEKNPPGVKRTVRIIRRPTNSPWKEITGMPRASRKETSSRPSREKRVPKDSPRERNSSLGMDRLRTVRGKVSREVTI